MVVQKLSYEESQREGGAVLHFPAEGYVLVFH